MKLNLLFYRSGLLTLIVFLNEYISNAQKGEFKFSNDKFIVRYNLTDGMLDGKYVSCYRNGNNKTEGQYHCNNKIGKWDVYDSNGVLKIERFYKDNYQYTQSIPTIPKDSTLGYVPERTIEGYYKYSTLSEKQIPWAERTWTYFFNTENPLLSSNNRMFSLLYSLVTNHQIKSYKFKNDIDQIFNESTDILPNSLDTSHLHIMGFMTKEDWFYDKDRNTLDCRTLGICPIIKRSDIKDSINRKYLIEFTDKTEGDTIGLFWAYYPQVRKFFAKEKIINTSDTLIQNMDDMFFWRYYSGRIFAQSVIVGHQSPVIDSWGLIMKTLNVEQDIWLGYPTE